MEPDALSPDDPQAGGPHDGDPHDGDPHDGDPPPEPPEPGPRKLAVFDFDSTLYAGEVIDDLARRASKLDEVAALTEAAMSGGLDFAEALSRRLGLLGDLTRDDVAAVTAEVTLRPGGRELLSELRRRSWWIAILSGGFLDVLDPLLTREGCEPDHLFANQLRFGADGRLLPEAVVHVASNKGELVRSLRENLEVRREHCVAVGDGATDVPMFEEAGLGIAVHGKPAARAAADVSFEGENLAELLRYFP